VQSLDTGARKVVLEGARDARYVPSGHLVYVASGDLLAIPFDAAALKITGGPVPLVDDVARANNSFSGAAHFAVSNEGTLVYVPGSRLAPQALRMLMWVDRQGPENPISVRPRLYSYPRLSPDGSRIAMHILGRDGGTNIWILELGRGSFTRLVSDRPFNYVPMWTADGRHVIFNSGVAGRSGASHLVSRAADGSGSNERLAENMFPTGISPDGSQLVICGLPRVVVFPPRDAATVCGWRTSSVPNRDSSVTTSSANPRAE
jgi:Tol biopolymer transport system component